MRRAGSKNQREFRKIETAYLGAGLPPAVVPAAGRAQAQLLARCGPGRLDYPKAL